VKNTIISKSKDPVCGMDIQTTATTAHAEHSGQTYYFCGSRCKEKFDKHPEQYLVTPAGASESGHDCCG
jgi:YHS domain-containing protein